VFTPRRSRLWCFPPAFACG